MGIWADFPPWPLLFFGDTGIGEDLSCGYFGLRMNGEAIPGGSWFKRFLVASPSAIVAIQGHPICPGVVHPISAMEALLQIVLPAPDDEMEVCPGHWGVRTKKVGLGEISIDFRCK